MRVRVLLQITGDEGAAGDAMEVAAFEKRTERPEDLDLSIADGKALVENHDEFASAVAVAGVRWEKLAAYLAEHGLGTARGDIPSGETTRRCWMRARRLVAKQRRSAPASVPAAQPGRPEGKPAPALPADPKPVAAPAGQPKPKFEFARLRNEGRGVSDAERRALGDPTAPVDPDDTRWSGDKSR
ncbi:MAG TPA: hypothetical protein VME47_15895 [Acetobacteraceae bacterium]|nr:hypothetical protein [Acetobacteraceae bacterium]